MTAIEINVYCNPRLSLISIQEHCFPTSKLQERNNNYTKTRLQAISERPYPTQGNFQVRRSYNRPQNWVAPRDAVLYTVNTFICRQKNERRKIILTVNSLIVLTLNNKRPSSLLFKSGNKNLPCLQVFEIFTFSKNPNRKRYNHRLQINQNRCSWTPHTEDTGNYLPANSPCWNIFLRYQSLARFICKSVVTCFYSGFSNQHKDTTKSGAFIRTRDLQKAGKVKDLVEKKDRKI